MMRGGSWKDPRRDRGSASARSAFGLRVRRPTLSYLSVSKPMRSKMVSPLLLRRAGTSRARPPRGGELDQSAVDDGGQLFFDFCPTNI